MPSSPAKAAAGGSAPRSRPSLGAGDAKSASTAGLNPSTAPPPPNSAASLTAPDGTASSPIIAAGPSSARLPPVTPTSALHDPLSEQNQAILAYLRERGYSRAETALKAELDALQAGKPLAVAQAASAAILGPNTVGVTELASKIAPREGLDETRGEQAAVEALRLDPTDRARGFGMLRAWCEGSLEIYQAELQPLLLPVFVHAYLDLVEMGFGTAAAALYQAHRAALLPRHASLLSSIRALALPSHVHTSSIAQRFRSERYVIKMSPTVFGLLVGWLTDGAGPVARGGAAEGVSEGLGEPEQRARTEMLKILNQRCRIQVLRGQLHQLTHAQLEEGTGLTGVGPSYSSESDESRPSRHHPSLVAAATSDGDVVADFNASAAGPQLKLGPAIPLTDRLQAEVEKELRHEEKEEEARIEREKKAAEVAAQAEAGKTGDEMEGVEATAEGSATAGDAGEKGGDAEAAGREASEKPAEGETREGTPSKTRASTAPGTPAPSGTAAPTAKSAQTVASAIGEASSDLVQPTLSDLPPQPLTFRNVDIQREVAKLRDARKALRFDLSLRNNPAAAAGVVATTSGGDASAASVGATAAAPNGATVGAPTTLVASAVNPSWSGGVRDSVVNGLGAEGARAARVAALPSICAYTYHDADDGLTCSTFSADTTLMAGGFEESFVQIWSLKGEPLQPLRQDLDLTSIRDARSLKRQRQEAAKPQTTRRLIGHSGPVYGVAFDNVGGSAMPPRHLLSSSADGTARLWSLDTFSALVSWRGHQHPVWDVKWSPLGGYFATASADRTARLWSTERANPLRIYAGHLSDVDCLDFHPNSLYLATGSSDRTARLWDTQRGACVRVMVGHQSAVSCLKVSPDGRYLATAGAGGSATFSSSASYGPNHAAGSKSAHSTLPSMADECAISLWDLGSGRRIKKMWGHTSRVQALDFSRDGALLVSTSADCTVRCWDVRNAGGPRLALEPGSVEAQQASAAAAAAAGGAATTANGTTATSTVVVGGVGPTAGASSGAGSGAQSIMPGAPPPSGAMPLSRVAKRAAPPAPLQPSVDCVATFYSKRTPFVDVRFTPRNVCLVAGAYDVGASAAEVGPSVL